MTIDPAQYEPIRENAEYGVTIQVFAAPEAWRLYYGATGDAEDIRGIVDAAIAALVDYPVRVTRYASIARACPLIQPRWAIWRDTGWEPISADKVPHDIAAPIDRAIDAAYLAANDAIASLQREQA